MVKMTTLLRLKDRHRNENIRILKTIFVKVDDQDDFFYRASSNLYFI